MGNKTNEIDCINPYLDDEGLFGWNKQYYRKNRKNIPWIRTWEVIIKIKKRIINLGFFEDPYTSNIVLNLVYNELKKEGFL
jgi:hypothetical protein